VGIDNKGAAGDTARMGPRYAAMEGNMTPEAIGERLRLLREAFDMSASEIADLADIPRPHWSMYENGKRVIPYDKASRLVTRFGVTLDFIILGRWAGIEFATAERLRKAAA
jgi:transcriptional regulator with XRE-family HTH domain